MPSFTQPIPMAVDELLEGVRAELAIKLFGDDLARVVHTVAGAADVQVDQVNGTPQLLIRVDRQAIARYGINVADVQHVIRATVGGETVGQVFEGIRRFDIQVRFAPDFRDTPEAIARLLVQSPDGIQVPLAPWPGSMRSSTTERRLRPALMTAISTGLGLLPLLFATGVGSEVQRPLATSSSVDW